MKLLVEDELAARCAVVSACDNNPIKIRQIDKSPKALMLWIRRFKEACEAFKVGIFESVAVISYGEGKSTRLVKSLQRYRDGYGVGARIKGIRYSFVVDLFK